MEVSILPSFKIFYRIGMAPEKKVLAPELPGIAYHGICFSANVACFGKTWVSQFINLLRKPFFIDPMTYAFQFPLQNISKGNTLRKSFLRLAEIYGDPIKTMISSGREVNPSDLTDDDVESMTKNIFDFQESTATSESSSQKSLVEFGEWLGERATEQKPEFIVSPYFWFDSPESDFYYVNLRIMKLGKKYSSKIPVYGVICTNVETLSNDEWVSKIVLDFSTVDGILLWISDFNEHRMTGNELMNYLNFVQELSRNRTVIVMYGSYFSMIASKFGLTGISPGIGIGESKNVKEQPTGGAFSNRYYVFQAKTMTVDANARNFYMENPETLCKCNICGGSKVISKEEIPPFFDELTPLKAKRHYCMCRALELEEIEKNDIDTIKIVLDSNIRFCLEKKMDMLYGIEYKHQARWHSAISDFSVH